MFEPEVRSIAIGITFKLFCKYISEVPITTNLLIIIIKLAVSALNSENEQIITELIIASKTIFTLDYRGLLVLIPIYLQKIKDILNISKGYSNKAKSAAISILGSLISVPNHYKDYSIPLYYNKSKKISMSEIETDIWNNIKSFLLIFSSKNIMRKTNLDIDDMLYIKTINKAICCASVIIYQESVKPSPRFAIINEDFVNAILSKIEDNNIKNSIFALSCLCSISYLFPLFEKLDKGIITQIFFFINKLLIKFTNSSDLRHEKVEFLSELLSCLLVIIF